MKAAVNSSDYYFYSVVCFNRVKAHDDEEIGFRRGGIQGGVGGGGILFL